jgi:adenine-specific DNA-methyltransferase
MKRRTTCEFRSEYDLISAALALRAEEVRCWPSQEQRLVRGTTPLDERCAVPLAGDIARGKDPLGETFTRLRAAEQKRQDGATYTPLPIVKAMLGWAASYAKPLRIVDPGVGSGRFLLAAAKCFPEAELFGSILILWLR